MALDLLRQRLERRVFMVDPGQNLPAALSPTTLVPLVCRNALPDPARPSTRAATTNGSSALAQLMTASALRAAFLTMLWLLNSPRTGSMPCARSLPAASSERASPVTEWPARRSASATAPPM
jgi:hypothetical protein